MADFAIEHTDVFRSWQRGSNYLCCLVADTEAHLEELIRRVDSYGHRFTVFREPDIGNQITAVAVEALPKDTHKKLFKSFKLTGHEL